MSKIVIKVENVQNKMETVACIRRITGIELREINKRLQLNEPIVEYVLFNNDHEEIEKLLRQLMEDVPSTGASLRFYELSPDETFTTCSNVAELEITTEILCNILHQHEEGLAKLR